MKTSNSKCLLIMAGQDRCLVLNEGTAETPRYRFPRINELTLQILDGYKPELVGNCFVIKTKEELQPWDALTPFPPQHYYDYSYLSLTDTSTKEWEFLESDDKKDVSAVRLLQSIL